MTTTVVHVGPGLPMPIPENRFAQNLDIPSPAVLGRAGKAFNSVSALHRKVAFTVVHDTQSTPAPASAFEAPHYFCFRTGENVASINILAGLAPASTDSAGNSPSVQLSLSHSGGTINGTQMYYPRVDVGGSYTPAQVSWMQSEITVADGLASNTEYLGFLSQYDYARISSLSIIETASRLSPSSTTGVCNPLNHESFKPITNSGAQDLAETGTKLWQHNGSQLISWSRHSIATTPTPTNTTWVNVWDGSAVFSATSTGLHLATQYHDSAKADIPVVLGVYATRSSGTGTLEVKLEQSGGTLLTKTGIGTTMNPFNSSTHTIAAAAPEKTDILVRSSDVSTWKVIAIGLWEYET